jgi:PAS domain S-box-containing protein/putative nucleotidyltransferase with HDIG domain
MERRQSLEALYQLSLKLGTTLDLRNESTVLINWLKEFIRPRMAVVFLVDQSRQYLDVVAQLKFQAKESRLNLGLDPWDWLERQKIRRIKRLPSQSLTLPIVYEGELLGILIYVSRRQGKSLDKERKLVNMALSYFSPVVRNIQRYLDVERLLEKRTAELRLSEERHRYISELISDYAYSLEVDEEGRLKFEWMSQSFLQIFSLTEGEKDGLSCWLALVHPDDKSKAVNHLNKVLKGEQDVCELRFVTSGSGIRWLRNYARPVLDVNQGRVIRIYGAAQDITERKEREEILERQIKELRTIQAFGAVCSAATEEDKLIFEFMKLFGETFFQEDFGLYLFDEAAGGLFLHPVYRQSHGQPVRFIPLGQGIIGQVALEGKPRRIGDVRLEKNYIAAIPTTLSELAVPVKIREKVIGVINTESSSLNYFSADDERLLQIVAFQLGSTIERIRLEREREKRLLELEALYKITVALRQAESSREALAIILEELLAALDLKAGSIYIYDEATKSLQPVASRGWLSELRENSIEPGKGIVGHVFATGETYFSRDLKTEPLALKNESIYFPEGWGAACFPIKLGSKILGAIFISMPQSQPVRDEHINLINSCTEIAGIALHRLELNEETRRRLKYLQTLRSIELSTSATTELKALLEILIDQIISHLEVDAAAIFLFNSLYNHLEFGSGHGFKTGQIEEIKIKLGAGFLGEVAQDEKITHIQLDNLGFENDSFQELWLKEGFKEGYIAPLLYRGEIKGNIVVFFRQPYYPRKEWLEFFDALRLQIAIAIAEAQLFEELKRANIELTVAYDATIEGWVKTLDIRDKETEDHTQRVTALTLEIARTMGLPNEQLVHIRRGAILHDIGKIAVPDHILFKNGPLTEEEWAIMRRHPQLAYEILSPIKFLRPALDIPYCHHERWNGSGYPRGLKGEEIPLPARIFAVVDVYDALTSKRPYREALSREEALAYIKEKSGELFDPEVVEIFLSIMKKKVQNKQDDLP